METKKAHTIKQSAFFGNTLKCGDTQCEYKSSGASETRVTETSSSLAELQED